jgi:hypothetical protein
MQRTFGLVAKHVFLLAVVIGTVVLLIVVGRIPNWQGTSRGYAGQFNNCNANGTFTPNRTPTFSLWDGSGLFQITLTWGHLTFSQAKALDVVWDIVVGRGGQFILLYVTFKVFAMTLSRTMETEPVSYGTFESMAFTSPTFVSPFILIRDFVTNKGLRARVAVGWTIIASFYVLAFPTLNDTVSGYSTNMEAFLEDNSGILVPWSNYTEVQFVIHDGERIGLQSPTYISDNPSTSGSCALKGPRTLHSGNDIKQVQAWDVVPKNCTLFWHVVECKSNLITVSLSTIWSIDCKIRCQHVRVRWQEPYDEHIQSKRRNTNITVPRSQHHLYVYAYQLLNVSRVSQRLPGR